MSDPLFQISSLDRGVTHLRLAGDLDVGIAVALRQSLDGLIEDGHTRLLVDLTHVDFIDSSGLAVLLHAVRQLRRRRGRLAVVCPNPAMRELFGLVGHNLLFPVDETVDQALRHLRARRRFERESADRSPQSADSAQPHSGN